MSEEIKNNYKIQKELKCCFNCEHCDSIDGLMCELNDHNYVSWNGICDDHKE